MSSKTYSELLKRPEWKARRLEILARDKNTCQSCNATKYLQVHHLKYLKDKMPWESPNKDLITLCRSCHNKVHDIFQPAPEIREVRLYSKKNPLVGNGTILVRGKVDMTPNTFLYRSKEMDEVMEVITGYETRLLFYIMRRLKKGEDFIALSNKEVMQDFKVKSRSIVSTAIKGLISYNIIAKSTTRGEYWINPHFIFNGNRIKYFPDNAYDAYTGKKITT